MMPDVQVGAQSHFLCSPGVHCMRVHADLSTHIAHMYPYTHTPYTRTRQEVDGRPRGTAAQLWARHMPQAPGQKQPGRWDWQGRAGELQH